MEIRYLFFFLMAAVISPVVHAGEQKCTSEATAFNKIEIRITSEGGCVVLSCENVLSKNIESALALCHQTEKNYSFCGWQSLKNITNVKLKLVKEGQYSVTLKKCALNQ